jgi:bifunctional DNA-binding transcriptional regulator/antitoxin component of YhaV-PrlF toxin-antitoxin module
MSVPIRAEPETARLRSRNQLTLPERVASRIGAKPGDRFLIAVEGPDTVRLVRVRDSYAGALQGMWGADKAAMDAWMRDERASWDARQRRYEGEITERP